MRRINQPGEPPINQGNHHPPPKTNMAMGKSTMNEDVFPVENGDFPASHVSFRECRFSVASCSPPVMTAPRDAGAFLREAPLDRTTAEPMEVEEDCCLVVFGGLNCKGTAKVILHRYIYIYMGVSKNRSTPKSSILIGFSIINHPFSGTPIFGHTHIYILFIYI